MKDNLVKINLSEIDSFKEHPFSVNKDDQPVSHQRMLMRLADM